MSEVCQHRGHSGSVAGQWSLLISGDRREEGETDTDWGQNTPELSSDPAKINIGCWELGLSTGGWGGHQWLGAEELKMAVNSERGEP